MRLLHLLALSYGIFTELMLRSITKPTQSTIRSPAATRPISKEEMMRPIMFGIAKIGFAIALIAAAIVPGGPGNYIFNNYMEAPSIFGAVVAIWWIMLMINLPLSRVQFIWSTKAGIIVLFGISLYNLWDRGLLNLSNGTTVGFTIAVFAGLVFGWWTIGTQVWKSYRNITAVDDPDTGDE